MTTLDGWCALNSSVGLPLLAVVTIGGFLAAGRSLISFPKVVEGGPVSTRNKKNRLRSWVLFLGIVTAVFLLVDVGAYVYAFSQVRNVEKVCPDKLSDSGFWAVWIFFICAGATALIGSTYAFMLAKLKG